MNEYMGGKVGVGSAILWRGVKKNLGKWNVIDEIACLWSES
jgi:hypothetical protein